MPPKAGDAFQQVLKALEKVEDEEVNRIFNAIMVLRGISPAPVAPVLPPQAAPPAPSGTPVGISSPSDRPKAFGEVYREKLPTSNPQVILTYAYYLDKYGGKQRFSRDDLSKVYSEGKLTPDPHFARDVGRLVKAGLVHEAGENSYITSTGIETVEGNFATMRPGPKGKARKAKKSARGKKR